MDYNHIDIFDKTNIEFFGRNYIEKNANYKMVMFGYSACGFEIKVKAKNVFATFYSETSENIRTYINVYIDNKFSRKIALAGISTTQTVCISDLNDGQEHLIRVIKVNGVSKSKIGLIEIMGDNLEVLKPNSYSLSLEFYGDSITCGYGVDGGFFDKPTMENEDASKSFAYIASQQMKAKHSMICMSGLSLILEKYVTGFTMLDMFDKLGGMNTKTYIFDQMKHCIIINLGTNDENAIPNGKGREFAIEKFKKGYQTFIEKLMDVYPNVPIVCCYNSVFKNAITKQIVNELVDYYKSNGITYIYAFELIPNKSGVRSHPNAKGQLQSGEALAEFLKSKVLKNVILAQEILK